jgi:hypothetical protein
VNVVEVVLLTRFLWFCFEVVCLIKLTGWAWRKLSK